MQTKYFNSSLVPMSIPVFDGLESLRQVDNSMFPLYARPHVEGVEVMIRHGFIHFTDKGYHHFCNIGVKEKFKTLLEFSRVNHYSLHATFKSATMDDIMLRSLLASYDACTYEESIAVEDGVELYSYQQVLPEDLTLVVTDIIMDCYAEQMSIDTRKATLWFLNREIASEGLVIQVPEYCIDNDHLDLVLNEYRNCDVQVDGVALYGDGTVYAPGNSSRNVGAVIIKLTEEIVLDVLDESCEVKYIVDNSPMRGRFVLYDETRDSIQEVRLDLLTNSTRELVRVSSLLNLQAAKVTVKRLNLRTLEVPEILTINGVSYAA